MSTDIPPWRTDLFTDEERSVMVSQKMAEIAESIRGVAAQQLDGEDFMGLMPYVDPDLEVTADLLQAIRDGHACMADYESGEFGHHATSATHIRRFGLVDEAGENLTDLGRKYLEEFR